MNLESMIEYIRPDFCISCNRQSIEIYDYFNNSLNYSRIISNYVKGLEYFISKPIYSMKCTNCKTQYFITFNEDHFPVPLRDIPLITGFINKFVQDGLNSRKRDFIE